MFSRKQEQPRSNVRSPRAHDYMQKHYRDAVGQREYVGSGPAPANDGGREEAQAVKPVRRAWRKAVFLVTGGPVLASVAYFGAGFDGAAKTVDENVSVHTAPAAASVPTPTDSAKAVETPIRLPEVPMMVLAETLNPHVPDAVDLRPEKVIPEAIINLAKPKITASRPHVSISSADICKAIVGRESVVTSDFGARGGTRHEGVDCRAWYNRPVHALFEGTVAYADNGYNKGFGQVVIVRSEADPSVHAIYAHANELKVRKGDFVRQGDEVILAGNSGHSTGPHVHIEIHHHQKPVNLPAHPQLVNALFPKKSPGSLSIKALRRQL